MAQNWFRWSDYWKKSEQDTAALANELLVDVYFDALAEGIDILPPEAQILVNWQTVNGDAMRWMRENGLKLARRVDNVTMTHAREIINDWIESGAPLDTLEAALEPWFGAARADRIAVTEVTAAYAAGNQKAWEGAGVVGQKQWNTVSDELVCPICGPLDKERVPLDGQFEIGDATADGPPAHPNCRCEITPVVDMELVSEQFKRILEAGE